MPDINSIEDNNRRGVRILTLDGGGIKGLVELQILLEIQRRTGKQINEIFDLVVGTSTGGTIALITGLNLQGCARIIKPSSDIKVYQEQVKQELSKPLPQRIGDLYKQLANNIFKPFVDNSIYKTVTTLTRYWISYFSKIYLDYGYGGAMYSTQTLADMSAQYLQPEFGIMSQDQLLGISQKYPENKMTNVCVVSAFKVGNQSFRPYLFRSYHLPDIPPPRVGIESQYQNGLEDTWGVSTFNNNFYINSGTDGLISCAAKVWEAARATSAAPGVFAPIILKFDGKFQDDSCCTRSNVETIAFVDGGIVANNPSEIAIDEALKLFDGRPIDCLVSLGTGQKAWSTEERVFALRNGSDVSKIDLPQWMSTLDQMVTNSEYAHTRVRNRIALSNEKYHAYTEENDMSNSQSQDPLAQCTYFRFNPQCMQEDYSMTEWHPEKLEQMENSTKEYLNTRIIKSQLDVLTSILTETDDWKIKAAKFRKRTVTTLLPAQCGIQ